METHDQWYKNWFNEDYLKLYSHRDIQEAKQHIRFLKDYVLDQDTKNILDLGCGSGRHALLLASYGYHVTGVDSSGYLIQQAQDQAKKNRLTHVNFIEGDIRSVSLSKNYDLVISMFTSFGYFKEDKDNLSILRKAHQVLKKKKLFFLDYLNPDFVKDNLIPEEKKTVDGKQVIITRKIIDQSVVKTIHFPQKTYQEIVKLYTQKEMEDMLKTSLFTVINTWGSYDSKPLTKTSPRQIYLSRS